MGKKMPYLGNFSKKNTDVIGQQEFIFFQSRILSIEDMLKMDKNPQHVRHKTLGAGHIQNIYAHHFYKFESKQ